MFTECYKRLQLEKHSRVAADELILKNRSGLMALHPCRQRRLSAMRLNKEHSEVRAVDLHARLVGKLRVCDREEVEFQPKHTTREAKYR